MRSASFLSKFNELKASYQSTVAMYSALAFRQNPCNRNQMECEFDRLIGVQRSIATLCPRISGGEVITSGELENSQHEIGGVGDRDNKRNWKLV